MDFIAHENFLPTKYLQTLVCCQNNARMHIIANGFFCSQAWNVESDKPENKLSSICSVR